MPYTISISWCIQPWRRNNAAPSASGIDYDDCQTGVAAMQTTVKGKQNV
jgi:hypothetical protein